MMASNRLKTNNRNDGPMGNEPETDQEQLSLFD